MGTRKRRESRVVRCTPFVLVATELHEHRRASLLQKGPVAIVFHRSVDWCMYCKLQMIQLQRIQGEIEAAGGTVAGISYDSAEILESPRGALSEPCLLVNDFPEGGF